MDRLKREGNPPVGQLASPVPQYKDTVLNDWAELQGEGGASYVKDRDALAKLEQVKSELELVKAELAAIKANQLSGDQKVQLSGNIVPLVGTTKTLGPNEVWELTIDDLHGSTKLNIGIGFGRQAEIRDILDVAVLFLRPGGTTQYTGKVFEDIDIKKPLLSPSTTSNWIYEEQVNVTGTKALVQVVQRGTGIVNTTLAVMGVK